MKKFLSILAAVGLTATASTAVVACTTSVKMGDVKVAEDGKSATATIKEKDAKSAHLVEKQDGKWVLTYTADSAKLDGTIKDTAGATVTITVAFALVTADGTGNGDVTLTLTITTPHAEVKKTTLKITFGYQLKDKDAKTDGKFNISGFKLAAVAA